jgi:hypothetical protein
MAEGMKGFIETFFMAEQLKNQRELLAMQQHNSEVERARVLTDLARMSDTEDGREMIGMLSQDPQFQEFVQLNNLAPTLNTMVERGVMRGLEAQSEEQRADREDVAAGRALTGMDPGALAGSRLTEQLLSGATPREVEELGPQARTRHATGVGRGQLALDEQLAQLDPMDQRQIVRYMHDLDLNPMQREQVAQWAASHNLQLMGLVQQGALGEVGLILRAFELDALMGAQAAGGAGDEPSSNTLMSQISEGLRSLQSIGRGTPNELVLAEAARINNSYMLLARRGLMPSDEEGNPVIPLLPMDADQLRDGKIMSTPLFQFLRGTWRGMTGYEPPTVNPEMFRQGFPPAGGGPGAAGILGRQPTIAEMITSMLQSRIAPPPQERDEG